MLAVPISKQRTGTEAGATKTRALHLSRACGFAARRTPGEVGERLARKTLGG